MLGFIETKTKYIYVGSAAPNSPWYFCEKDGEQTKQVPIFSTCLACYLTGIDVVHREHPKGTATKLIVSINAGENYKIQAGIDTWFAKTLVVRLNELDPVSLTSQLYIHASCGDDGKVVFARLQNCFSEWIKKPESFDYKTFDEVAITECVYAIKEKLKMAQQMPKAQDEPLEDTPF